MKYIKTYESVKDHLTPRSSKEIIDSLNKLPIGGRIAKIEEYKFWNFFSDDEIKTMIDNLDTHAKLIIILRNNLRRLYSESEIVDMTKKLESVDKMYIGCRYGLLWLVKDAISDNVKPDFNYNYPITLAANNNHIDIVKYLMTFKEVDPSDHKNRALKWCNNSDILDLLMSDDRVRNSITQKELRKLKMNIQSSNTPEIFESVKQHLQPKSKEEIIASLNKSSSNPEVRLDNIFDYGFEKIFTNDEMKKFIMDIEPDKRIHYINDYKLKRLFTDEELYKIVLEMDPSEILEYEFKNKSLKGIKYVLDNYRLYGRDTKTAISVFIPFIENKQDMKFLLSNEQISKFLNSEQVYVLEKYVLGKHQNEIHYYEEDILDIIEDGEYYQSTDNPNIMTCKINNENLFNYNKQTKKLVYHLDNLGKFLRVDQEDWSGKGILDFSFKWNEVIIKGLIEKKFNIEIDEVDGSRNDNLSFVKN